MINFLKRKTRGYENINSTAFRQKLDGDADGVLLDVRTEREYNEAHLPESLLIDFNGPSFRDRISELDKSKNYYLYCRSGARSASACKIMADLGFKKLYNLSGGILGWDGPIEK